METGTWGRCRAALRPGHAPPAIAALVSWGMAALPGGLLAGVRPAVSVAVSIVAPIAASVVASVAASVAVLASVVAGVLAGGAARADQPGVFDYYVVALSWSPTWCALEGDARGADQCDARHDHGFTLHGLWPQYESGWPDYCRSSERAPSRGMTGAMADIMGSGGLAWHQWKKHGSCTGLSARDYFRLSRLAYDGINRPPVLRKVTRPLRLPAHVIEEAFLKANPGMTRRGITVTCKSRRIAEVRICLDRQLRPRDCAPDAARDCRLEDALFAPIR